MRISYLMYLLNFPDGRENPCLFDSQSPLSVPGYFVYSFTLLCDIVFLQISYPHSIECLVQIVQGEKSLDLETQDHCPLHWCFSFLFSPVPCGLTLVCLIFPTDASSLLFLFSNHGNLEAGNKSVFNICITVALIWWPLGYLATNSMKTHTKKCHTIFHL